MTVAGERMTGMDEGTTKLALTVPETARAIGVSPRQVYHLMHDAALPSIRVGGRRLVRMADLKQWLASQPVATGQAAGDSV